MSGIEDVQKNIVPIEPPTPEERLQASRLALEAWIQKTYHFGGKSETTSSSQEPQEPGWLGIVSDSLTDVPAAKIALRWVKRWWRNHPWRATADLASLAGRELAKPLATKHPWLLIGGAVVAGGLLVRLKPWRWVSGGALLAGFLPRFSIGAILETVTASLYKTSPPDRPEVDNVDSRHMETSSADANANANSVSA